MKWSKPLRLEEGNALGRLKCRNWLKGTDRNKWTLLLHRIRSPVVHFILLGVRSPWGILPVKQDGSSA
jgi:hypothetical protein